jgi:hypothetical protein
LKSEPRIQSNPRVKSKPRINSEARIKSKPRIKSAEAPIFPRIKIRVEDKFRAVETF